VTGDTLVCLTDGRRVPINSLVGAAPEVFAMSGDGKIVAAKSEAVWRLGRRAVVAIRTASGRTIRATGEHRLFSGRGWSTVRTLREGDHLALVRRLPEPAFAEVGRHAIVHGCLVDRYAASGTTDENDVSWDRIVSIEPAGQEDVFDLTVPGPASWLADGIVSHNSGALEQDADVIMFLHRPSFYSKDPMEEEARKTAEVHVGKQRNGPTGKIEVAFLSQYARFENLAAGDRQFEPF
jgi:replicative DNA helicase